MKLPTENKGLAPAVAGKCPRCGRRGGACRDVPLGHFCQQYGLEEDRTKWIHPSPDPASVAVRTDPDVLTATMEENLAQAEYEKADGAWKDALARLATAKIQARNGAIVTTPTGEVTYTAPSRRDRKREEKMRAAEAEASEAREVAHAALVKAHDRRRIATQDARIAATIREQGW